MENEIWRPIAGFEGLYEVSNCGRIKSLARLKSGKIRGAHRLEEKIKSQNNNNMGYPCVTLTKDGKKSPYLVHRLVAKAFISNDENLPVVNHKNGLPSDSRAENLEWCTQKQNINHAIDVLGKRVGEHGNHSKGFDNYKSIPVLFKSTNGEIQVFENYFAAAKALGYHRGTISDKLRGVISPFTKCGGEIFKITKEQFLTYINN
jgi:hypothetical protein